jgi:hypothetical protein
MVGHVLLRIALATALATALAVALAAVALLIFRAAQIWRDAGRRGFATRRRIGLTLGGSLLPARYWWGARIGAMSPREQSNVLAHETGELGMSRADSQRCPLCGAEIAHAWALTGAGDPDVAPGPVQCPACDFRLDACRHCDRFLPGPPRGWGSVAFSEGDITYGRCGFYKKVQPVEQACAPDMARQLRARGYEQISAPMPIQDSMMRPDSCRAFKPNRKRIRASGIRWPDARRTALLRLLARASEPQSSTQERLFEQDNE